MMREQWRCHWLILVMIAVISAGAARAEEVIEDYWYVMELSGAKVGWTNARVVVEGERRLQSTEVKMSLKRGGMTIDIANPHGSGHEHDGTGIRLELRA